MKNKPKNYSKKGSMLTLVVLISCFIFTSCSKDDDLSVTEPETSVLSKSLYFYGSDAEFKELQGVEMTHITSEKQLNGISKTVGDSYALFVGKDIDVSTGLVDNLRNAGILVTQLNEKIAEPKKLSAQTLLLKGVTSSNGERTRTLDTEKSLDNDKLYFTTYLSVNGEHKTLISMSKNMEEAVTSILEWSEKKMKERKKESVSKSGNKTFQKRLELDISWYGVADFSINTVVFLADTDGYIISNGIEDNEYPNMLIYDHKISMISKNSNYRANDLQILQQPLASVPFYYDASIRKYYPRHGDNQVLNGRTGSDSYGYGINASGGFSLAGPDVSVGVGFDWSHSTDWSIPASQLKAYHNETQNRFHIQYDVDPMGEFAYQSNSAVSYTYYATRGMLGTAYRFIPITYAFGLYNPSEGNSGFRTLLVELDSYGRINIAKFQGLYLSHEYVPVMNLSGYASQNIW